MKQKSKFIIKKQIFIMILFLNKQDDRENWERYGCSSFVVYGPKPWMKQ